MPNPRRESDASADRPDADAGRALAAHTRVSSMLRSVCDAPVLQDAPVPGVFHAVEGLVGHVAHAGRNLLGPIKGYASLIQDAVPEGSNERRWADRIERAADALEDFLVRLGMCRVAGACETRETTWAHMIHRAVRRVRGVNGGRARIEIVNASRDPFVQHEELIVRCLVHVLLNAVEASPRGGRVVVSVEERRVADGGALVREFTVTVRDDGEGIAPEAVDDVVRPFYTTRHDHAGLGLATVAAAAPVIGMDVDIESTVGEGTTVTLVLRETRRTP